MSNCRIQHLPIIPKIIDETSSIDITIKLLSTTFSFLLFPSLQNKNKSF